MSDQPRRAMAPAVVTTVVVAVLAAPQRQVPRHVGAVYRFRHAQKRHELRAQRQ